MTNATATGTLSQAKQDALHTAKIQLATEQSALEICMAKGFTGFDARECSREIARLTAWIAGIEGK